MTRLFRAVDILAQAALIGFLAYAGYHLGLWWTA